ncbi:hypothetical protein JCM1840_001521 [Sporobolomyces johnsonii]
MGVKTLWPELEPGHSISSWAQLSEDAFKRSKGVRGLRVGVDLSLWLIHMKRMVTLLDDEGNPVSVGANADLRMVFFRLCAFLQHGILAVFVFDGPHRPSWKRGKHIAGTWRGPGERELKKMFELMGMEWKRAEGEAEAELAEMNQRGEIDAVLSDDVDSFLFGAKLVIRNPSKTLSANQSRMAVARRAAADLQSSPTKASSSQFFSSSFPPSSQYDPVPASSDHALVTFSSDDILASTGLGRAELILIALMSGGDYATEGMLGCGIVHSKGLAQAGYAKRLLDGIKEHEGDPDAQKEFLAGWREEIADVLHTNRDKLFDKRAPALASKVLDKPDFPNLDVVRSYVHPRVSKPGSTDPPTWERRVDVPGLVTFTSDLFEWGHEELIAKFRNLVWIGLSMREMRRAALDADRGTSSSSSSYALLPDDFIQGITGLKTGPSTAFTPSYRIQLDPAPFDALVHSALPQPDPFPFPNYDHYNETDAAELRAERKRRGRVAEPPKKPDTGSFRHWVPRGFVEACGGGRERVREWKEVEERKAREKAEKEERKREKERAREEGKSSPVKKKASASQEARRGGGGRKKKVEGEDEDESAGTRKRLEEDRVEKWRAEILAKASAKGKGKAGADAVSQGKGRLVQDDSDSLPSTSRLASTSRAPKASTSTAIRLSSPLSSSDIEIETAPSTSRLRSKPRSPAANLLNSFTASKPTVPVASSSKAFPSSFSLRPSAFTSTKPADKPAPKRAVRPPSDSDDVLAASSDEDHVDKSRRQSKAQTSPSKKKRAPRNQSGGAVIDLSISSSSSESSDEGRIDSAVEEDMEEWFERRRRNAEISKGASGQAASSRIAKATSSNGGTKATQVLVLDDSD